MDRRDNRNRLDKTEDASAMIEEASFVLLTPHELRELKETILNLVSAALIQQPKASANDPTMKKITSLVKQVSFYDPEFALKLALYVRVDLNIRSTANYLVAVACNITSCQPYIKKYLSATIRLPSDWLDVPATYHTLPDKQLSGKSLPTCMRKALVVKFPDFDAYQLGKYNKERSIKRKLKKIKEEQAKGNKKARAPEKPQVTLKQLIRQLHISTPHLQVMCLIGKKYPSTEAEFRVSGLYGRFEPEKAGRRMKLPTPETWETLLSEKGNKSSTWEELIEHKKLPFMAMIRNLRNLIYTGVHPRYHRWVQNKLSNQQTVAQSKQFPFQFFSAYEVIPKNMEEFKKIMAGEVEKKPKPGAKPEDAKKKKKKVVTPTHMPNDKLFEDYRKAIDQAVKHATTYNVNPIKGSTVVFCNVSSETRGGAPGAKGMGSSVRSVQEIGYLLGLMCKYVCEDCDFRVWSSPGPATNGLNTLPVQLKEGSILDNMAAVAEVAAQLGDSPGEFPFAYLQDMIRDKRRVDNILVLSHHVINPSTGTNSKLSNLLNKYRQEVNSDLLFVSVDLSGSGKSAIGQDEKHSQDIQITGFSDQILRFIAERGDTNQLQYVEHIDEAKKLNKKIIEEVDVSPWWRFIETLGNDLHFQNITTGPKWREARIFISSTFIDMQGERDILTRVVLPEIKEKAKQRRVNLFEVDLRWGVTEEESQSGKSLQLCLDEVVRCQFFVGMLGERYGWAPESYDVPDHPRFRWLKDYPTGRSITELEMHLAALSNPDGARGAFFYMRDNLFMSNVPETYHKFFEAGHPHAEDKMSSLKSRIMESGVSFYEHYPCNFGGLTPDGHPAVTDLDFFGERVFHDLWGAISDHFPAEAPTEDPIELERSFHQAFVHETTRNFVGRKDMISAMTKHISGYHNQLMVLMGKPGDGKSSLMAHFSAQYATQNPRTFVLSHFIGASPTSSNIQYTLERLCWELKTVFSLEEEIPTDFKELTTIFGSFLEQASFKGKLVLIIDAVNQLDSAINRSHFLEWLPKKLPCKVILSTTPGKTFDNIAHRYNSAYTLLQTTPLDLGDRQTLVRQTLWQYHKKLDERPMNNQMKELLKKTDAGNPLYLMIACEELRVFGLYAQMNERIKRMSAQIPRLLDEVLTRLETDHGVDVIQNICGLLVASRGGLLEHELISMVPMNGSKWAALMRSLSAFLKPTGDSGEISFFHDSFKEAIRRRYFAVKRTEVRFHATLAEYFRNTSDPHANGTWLGGADQHSVSELVYHLVGAERWSDVELTLCDLNFIELKAMHGMITGLISDYALATADGLKYEGLSKVREFGNFVKSNAHVLALNPPLTFQQAANQPSATAPSVNAATLWANKQETRTWIGWENKPKENDACKLTLSGHSEGVTAVDFSRSSKLMACATRDCAILLYNSESGSLVATLVGHSGYIPALKFSPDGSLLVSASWDESIIVWDVGTELPLYTLTDHVRRVNDIAFSNDGRSLASASWDTTIKIYNTSSDFKCIRTIPTGEKPVNSVTWSSDDLSVLAGTWDGSIKVYSLDVDKEGTLLATMTGHTKSVQSLAFSPTGKHFISGSMDSQLRLWDAKANKFISTLSVHSKPVSSVTYSADGTCLLSASVDATVKVWDANLGLGVQQWVSPTGFATAVAMNPTNDQIIATGSSECSVSIWDISNNSELFRFSDHHTHPITSLEFSPNGAFLASASEEGKLIVWDTELGTVFYELPVPPTAITCVTFSPNGTLIAAACDDFTILVFDFTTGLPITHSPLRGHDNAVRGVSFAPSNNILVSAARDNSLRTWDVRTGKQLSVYRGHTDWITSVSYSSDGNRLVSCGWDNTVRVWNAKKQTPPKVLEGHDGAVISVKMSPNSLFVASCSYDGTIKIWDVKSGTEITTLRGHQGSVNAIGFNLKGDRLASVGDDGTIRIWDPLAATEKATLIGHSQAVNCATFSATNQIATASSDKTVKLWDVGLSATEDSGSYGSSFSSAPKESDKPKTSEGIRGHNAVINQVSLSPNGDLLLTASDDKTIGLWSIERNKKIRTIQSETGTYRGCTFGADPKIFFTSADDGRVLLWDTRTGKTEKTVTTHNGPATCVAVSSAGTVISGGWDNLVQVSDLRKPTVSKYSGHTDWVLSAVGVPKSSNFVSCGWDNTVRLWKGETNASVLAGHVDTITSVSVSPNGKLIASGSYDSTVKVWNGSNGKLEMTLAGHTSKVNQVAFTPNSELLLTASSDHVVKMWNSTNGELKNQFVCQSPATAVDVVTRNGELLMVFGDFIGNLYVTKLHWGF